MITQPQAEKALDWLRDNAIRIATAEAQATYLDEWRKVVRAQVMAEHVDLSVAAQEREALCDKRYHDAVTAHAEAVRIATELKWLARAAEAKISAWQTQSRNERIGP